MSKISISDTYFTLQIKALLAKVYTRSPLRDSVLDRAMLHYKKQPLIQKKLDLLKTQIDKVSNEGTTDKHKAKLVRLEREQRKFENELRDEANERHQHLLGVCEEIIELSEGERFSETVRRSSQFLGTLQIISPTEGKNIAVINEQHKALYKSVLCLRLLDELCLERKITDPYISERLGDISCEQYEEFEEINPEGFQTFIQEVKIPLLMAAILQDIGNNHPEAQAIMRGEDGKQDPFRMLEVEDRKKLLQINYRETIQYLIEGIGPALYVGNSKEERAAFNKAEHKKLLFIKNILKSAINPKDGIGNLLKVPQIYTSIILSTKQNYNYKLLPKVYQPLRMNAERGACDSDIVEALAKITGDFPQGYGVTLVPADIDVRDRYEYGIVSRLYPEQADQPTCRLVTKKLTFYSQGQNIELKVKNNLYFSETAKNFAMISKERLNEILELLASNYHVRKNLDLLPRCWQPGDFFSVKAHQNLWQKAR